MTTTAQAVKIFSLFFFSLGPGLTGTVKTLIRATGFTQQRDRCEIQFRKEREKKHISVRNPRKSFLKSFCIFFQLEAPQWIATKKRQAKYGGLLK